MLILIQQGLKSLSSDFRTDDQTKVPSMEEVLDIKQLLFLTLVKASVYKDRGEENKNPEDLNLALDQYEHSIAVIDRIRRGFLSESSKLFIQENFMVIYESAIETCYALYELDPDPVYLEKAFYFIEKSKSTVLSEALQVADVPDIQEIPREVLDREKELTSYIRSLELKLANSGIEENDSVQRSLQNQLFTSKTSLDSLALIIEEQYPNYHNLKYNMEVVHTSQVQESMDEKTAVLSFFEGDSTWYVFSLFKDQMSLIKVSKEKLSNKDIEKFRILVSDPSSDQVDIGKTAYPIYLNLLANSLEDSRDIERLIIVPSGQLGYIPFDALVSKPEGSPPYYLIQDYTVSYANSMTLIYQNRVREVRYEEQYIGFAPDYPEKFMAFIYKTPESPAYRDELTRLVGTREEVNFAGQIFKGATYLDQEATEQNFKNILSSPAILHLAMHALLNDQDPMRSQLIFSFEGDTVEDGRLNAYEIYNLKIRSELAVLSACNTGIGKINKGEGVMSLSRAFMYAGCPNIVMSLWRAKDQPSAQIISSFFQHLKNEKPKDEALRMAKLDYLSSADPLKSHPANWATFVLLGDSKPIDNSLKPIHYILGGILFILGVITMYLNHKSGQRQKAERN
jgi:CHAT domain-containing protein